MSAGQHESDDHDATAAAEEGGTLPPPTRQGLWVLYRGCWLKPQTAESVAVVQAQFEPRPDDVFLATYPKCGTTWLKALAFAVTNRLRHGHAVGDSGHPLLTNHPQHLVPFLELPDRRLHPLADDLDALASPRLLATHMPLSLLAARVGALGCRVVYMCREPKDVLVSYWHFASKVHADFSMDMAFELFCDGVSSYGPIWDHNLGYWRQSMTEPRRILFLKYEDMMADPTSHVKMLAEFLRVPFSDDEVRRGVVEEVVDLCSFDKLKSLPVNSSGVSDRFVGVPIQNSSYFRTGRVGDWATHFTQEMAEKLDAIVEEKFRGSGLRF
ncbi:cytosolic sulfotransferase 5-like [Aegilops tauschii subsp. strangulata]|uniref:Sulfotransferase n=3 Tax=Aegilops tauschii TaxID=37682 RepID=A0A453MTU2_AEGTS|nr:cytosolic sulfotransferase 5-like [Aegilops tauschii subsp. strangulata]